MTVHQRVKLARLGGDLNDDGHDLAANVPIADAGSHFVGTDVEAALQELATSGGFVAALNDLTDVTLTSPTLADRLRYNGSQWVNSTLHYVPIMVNDPSIVTTTGEAVYTVLTAAGEPITGEVA